VSHCDGPVGLLAFYILSGLRAKFGGELYVAADEDHLFLSPV